MDFTSISGSFQLNMPLIFANDLVKQDDNLVPKKHDKNPRRSPRLLNGAFFNFEGYAKAIAIIDLAPGNNSCGFVLFSISGSSNPD